MSTAPKLLALTLLLCACGPGGLNADSSGESSSDGSTSSASSTSSTSSTSSSSETDTTDTSTTDTSTTDTSDSSETLSFVPRRDMYELDCDMFAQDCPDDEKCVPYASNGGSWDANKCVPVMGDQATGEPCTYGGEVEATDDCDATSICWDVMDIDGEAIGTCHAFCTGTADMPECPESSQCLISGSGVIALCIPTCDPTLQDCDEGLACFWTFNDFSCIVTTQDIPAGEPCEFINDCAAGSGCLSAAWLPSCADSACCSPFCDPDLGDQPCEVLPGTACVPFFEQGMAPPGYEHVGMCMVPP